MKKQNDELSDNKVPQPTQFSAELSTESLVDKKRLMGGAMTKSLVVMAALVIVLSGVKAASAIVVPFFLAVFIAIICNPFIQRLVQFKIPRGLAVFLVMIFIVAFGLFVAGLVGQSFNDFTQSIPTFTAKFSGQLAWLSEQLAKVNITLNQQLLTEHFNPAVAMSLVTEMLKGLGNVMANVFLIILTVIFMLFEAPTIPNKVHMAFKDPEMKLQHIDRFLDSVNNYLVIKTVVSLITGILVASMLWWLEVEYFILWGMLSFLLNYIPNIGSIIAAVPAVLIALMFQGPITAGIAALGFTLINVVMGNAIEPRYMGKGLGLSTLVVFLSLIFWGWLLGSVGMLLSVPLTMIIKIGLEASDNGGWFAKLLGNG